MQIEFDARDLAKVLGTTIKSIQKGLPTVTLNVANYIRSEAKLNAQKVIYSIANKSGYKRTGKLLQSITAERVGADARATVGVKYGEVLEKGSRPHLIKPKNGKMLVFTVGGKKVFAKSVNHPGSKPRPYFYPAIESAKSNLNQLVAEVIPSLKK